MYIRDPGGDAQQVSLGARRPLGGLRDLILGGNQRPYIRRWCTLIPHNQRRYIRIRCILILSMGCLSGHPLSQLLGGTAVTPS